MFKLCFFIAILLVFTLSENQSVLAQDESQSDEISSSTEATGFNDIELSEAPQNKRSLVFLNDDHQRLMKLIERMRLAKRLGRSVMVDDLGLVDETQGTGEEDKPLVPTTRYLSLAGISYQAPENWIIWLNGKRMTPDALANEIIEIKVREDFVEIKWLDFGKGQVFPVRLRPNQKFDLETKTFLPG